jgi:RimJ/RimL family protein N-acetyltransferase
MTITFRKLQENDLEFLCNVRNLYSEEFLHDSRKFTIQQTISWFKETNPDFYAILVDGEIAGYFRLSNYSQTNRNIYIGADLHPYFCGKGIGYCAYKKFIDYIFKKYSLHKISLEVLKTNKRAISLYQKLGFITEGEKRDEVFKNGKFVDSIIMSMIINEKPSYEDC